MYNVNFSDGTSLGATQPLDEKIWDEVPGEDYKGGKFIREGYTDPETGARVETAEGIEAVRIISPAVAGEAAAEAMVAELLGQYQATAAALAARGILVGEPDVDYGCDDNMCVVTADYYVPTRTWVSRSLFDNEAEAKAHAEATKKMLQDAGWSVVATDVSREETGWFHVAHSVDVSPLYLALEAPAEGETLMPPIIAEEEEMVLPPTAAALTGAQKIGLGVGIGVAGLALVGGIVAVVMSKRREDAEMAPSPMAGYGRRPVRGRYSRP